MWRMHCVSVIPDCFVTENCHLRDLKAVISSVIHECTLSRYHRHTMHQYPAWVHNVKDVSFSRETQDFCSSFIQRKKDKRPLLICFTVAQEFGWSPHQIIQMSIRLESGIGCKGAVTTNTNNNIIWWAGLSGSLSEVVLRIRNSKFVP